MTPSNDNPNVRKGRFLWMNEAARRLYLKSLTQKIREGFYFSDAVLSRIADDLTPAFNDSMENE